MIAALGAVGRPPIQIRREGAFLGGQPLTRQPRLQYDAAVHARFSTMVADTMPGTTVSVVARGDNDAPRIALSCPSTLGVDQTEGLQRFLRGAADFCYAHGPCQPGFGVRHFALQLPPLFFTDAVHDALAEAVKDTGLNTVSVIDQANPVGHSWQLESRATKLTLALEREALQEMPESLASSTMITMRELQQAWNRQAAFTVQLDAAATMLGAEKFLAAVLHHPSMGRGWPSWGTAGLIVGGLGLIAAGGWEMTSLPQAVHKAVHMTPAGWRMIWEMSAGGLLVIVGMLRAQSTVEGTDVTKGPLTFDLTAADGALFARVVRERAGFWSRGRYQNRVTFTGGNALDPLDTLSARPQRLAPGV